MRIRLVVAVMAVLFAPIAVGANVPATLGEGAAVDQIGHASQFRAAKGFRSDRDYVEQSFRDSVAFPSKDFGVPLTDDEGRELARRIEVQIASDPSIADFQALPASAGVYMDQHRGGIPVFQTTDDLASVSTALRLALPEGIQFDTRSVARSRDDLRALKARIWEARPQLLEAGIDVRSASLDIKGNQVLVGIHDLETADSKVLIDSFGAGLDFVEEELDTGLDACLSRIDCHPMKGGIKIYETNHTSSICTSGYIVKLKNTSTKRVLTAGHCLALAVGGLNAGWSHSGTQFGTGRTETYGYLSNADAGLISVGAIDGADNLFMASGTGDLRGVEGHLNSSSQNVGDGLCRSGKTSGYLCGEITLEDRIRDVQGTSIEHQWVVDFDAIPGDSGGPYYLLRVAYGIHSSSTPANPPGGSAWYSPMDWVFSKLDSYGEPIVLCKNSTCSNATN